MPRRTGKLMRHSKVCKLEDAGGGDTSGCGGEAAASARRS